MVCNKQKQTDKQNNILKKSVHFSVGSIYLNFISHFLFPFV